MESSGIIHVPTHMSSLSFLPSFPTTDGFPMASPCSLGTSGCTSRLPSVGSAEHANEGLAALLQRRGPRKLVSDGLRLFISTTKKFNMQIKKDLIIHHPKLTCLSLARIPGNSHTWMGVGRAHNVHREAGIGGLRQSPYASDLGPFKTCK